MDPNFSYDRCDSPFDDDRAFISGLSGKSLQDELNTLAHSAKRMFVSLSIDGSYYWESLWKNRACNERTWMERSVNNLKPNWILIEGNCKNFMLLYMRYINLCLFSTFLVLSSVK